MRLAMEIDARKRLEVEKERIHKELLVTSRRAGMAEIATGVLHNVGNVLNSVNVAANLIADKTQNSRISSLAKLDDLLNQHTDDLADFITRDAKGRQIPSFVKSLSERLQQERADVLEEVASLTKNIDHIKEIVAMQQDYAQALGLKETLSLQELVEDALRIHSEAYTRHGVRVIREFQETPPVTLDKHKVMQILVNLLSNAKYACDANAKEEKCVWVRIEGNENLARVIVRDNGVGIVPENLTKIFQYGFTTRKGGRGFGLHSSANTAKELGGDLVAHSDGLGKGATFVLVLPLRAEKKAKLRLRPFAQC
jgi:signal transduction histidine kinase